MLRALLTKREVALLALRANTIRVSGYLPYKVQPLLGTLLQFSVGKGVFMTFPLWLIMILKGLLVPLEEYLEGGHWEVALDLQMLVSLCLCSCQHIITSLSLRTNGC
jgi:hypothetical protein